MPTARTTLTPKTPRTIKTIKTPAAAVKRSRNAALRPVASPKGRKTPNPAPNAAPQVVKTPKKPKALPRPSAPEKRANAAKPPKRAPKVQARMVRDSFTMPEADFALIAALKARALAGQRETKKSELLRAGLHALAALDGAALLAALGDLEPVKIGRPKKGHGHA